MKQIINLKNPKVHHGKKAYSFKDNKLAKKKALDFSEGLCGVLYQVSELILKPLNVTKSRNHCLLCMNLAIKYISHAYETNEEVSFTTNDKEVMYYDCPKNSDNFIQNWSNLKIKETYFKLFRYGLLHQRKEVRMGVMRLLRYLVKSTEEVVLLEKCNLIPLVVRSIDICIDNHAERVYGIRLARRLMQVAPEEFSRCLARCLISICKDGARESDKLLRSAQAVVNELAILNPKVFIDCGGVSSSLYGILDCSLPRINEALMTGLLHLLNDPKWRPSCSQFHMIMAPFSDAHYKHHEYSIDLKESEERDLRIQCSTFAILVAFRSWAGFISLYQPNDLAIETLVNLLRVRDDRTRRAVVCLLFDLFRIPFGTETDDCSKAVQERADVHPPEVDSWRLQEGFVAAEGNALLPHIAKYRPNLTQNYFALVLYTFLKKGLLDHLCEVIVNSENTLSIKTTILLGEILYLVDRNIPDCGLMPHALPLLSEEAAGPHSDNSARASRAISALLKLSCIRSKYSNSGGMSLYLRNITESNPEDSGAFNDESTKFSRWLGKDHDAVVCQSIKASGVLANNSSPSKWKWNVILPILQWPSNTLIELEDSSAKSFVNRLLQYFKPSSKQFSQVDFSHRLSVIQANTLVQFSQVLLKLHDEDLKYLKELLKDMSNELKNVVCELPFHDSCMSPSSLNLTVCQYYFLAIGDLSRTHKGYDAVQSVGIFDQMLAVVDESVSDIYAKLFTSTLDYTINGVNRTILSKVLTSGKECSRMYATRLLRVLLRARVRDFAKWGVELLCTQLYDENKLVAFAALEVFDELLDDEDCFQSVLKNPPSLQHLGDKGQLIFAKLIGSPLGFQTFHDSNFISSLLDKWSVMYNIKYVRLVETSLSEAMTHLQRGEDGYYGRRTGSKHVIQDVFLLPHLFGSLTQHKDGFVLLTQHDSLQNLIQIVRNANISNAQEIYKLKAAIWALAHLGSSPLGVIFLESENIVSSLVNLAAKCSVYSVRGTVFHALCVIATTWEGVNVLRKYGWESVLRNHHEDIQWRTEKTTSTEVAEAKPDTSYFSDTETDDRDTPKPGFYFMDESEEEMESFSLEDFEEEPIMPRKAQTLPHDTKPPSAWSHQRSFSDCAPLAEDLSSSNTQPSIASQSTTNTPSVQNRTMKLKNKILASIRRKSSSRRDSASSRASNSSSASEKMLSLFQRRPRRPKNDSLSFSIDGDRASSRSRSCTDDELIEDFGQYLGTPRSTKLEPIASDASLSTMTQPDHSSDLPKDQKSPSRDGDTYAPPVSQSLEERKGYLTLSPPRVAPCCSSLNQVKLKSVGIQKRATSESSHDDFQSKNSLRDFLSKSLDHAPHLGVPRSPSGCSELSSVRSFTNLGVRNIHKVTSSKPYEDLQAPSPGTRFMGLSIPKDTDRLLLEAPKENGDVSKVDHLPESLCDYSDSYYKDLKRHFNIGKSIDVGHEDEAFEYHSAERCLRCSISNLDSVARAPSEDGNHLDNNEIEEGLRGDQLSDSADEERREENKKTDDENVYPTDTKGRYLVRKEILRFVTNMANSFVAKSSRSGIVSLKMRMPWAFQDPCLYAEICALLSKYPYKLSARRFIQELFIDTSFKEAFEEASRIKCSFDILYSHFDTRFDEEEESVSCSEAIPEYSANEFEGFDMD